MKTVLITGGANGIGKALVEKFVNKYNVVVIDKEEKAIIQLQNKHSNIKCYIEDITNYKSINEIINQVFNEYKNVDVLINNAAIQTIEEISKLTIEDWKNVIEVNLTANFYMTQIISSKMKRGSTILNISSTHHDKPRVDHAHYDISKSGITTLTKLFALDLAKKKITVNALAIGATYTDMNKVFKINKKIESIAKNKIPLKHICTPEEIANYAFNIINDFSTATTGSIFLIDGGRNLHE